MTFKKRFSSCVALRSHRIWDDAAQDKALEWQITKKGVSRFEVGMWANWKLGPAQQATLQASSRPASKIAEISPQPLTQIIAISNTSQGENKRPKILLSWRLNPDQPAQPLTVCFQLCLFVCLLKDTRDCSSGEGYLHIAGTERSWNK